MSLLGLLGYKTAYVAFMGGTFLLFVAAVALFRRELAPPAGPRVLVLRALSWAR
jgi:hypothetical protein